MKKLMPILMSALFVLTMVTGCGSTQSPETTPNAPTSSASESNSEAAAPESPDSEAEQPAPNVQTDSSTVVYMTTDISPDGLMAVYEALAWTPPPAMWR